MLNRFIASGEEKVHGQRILDNISVQYFEKQERENKLNIEDSFDL